MLWSKFLHEVPSQRQRAAYSTFRTRTHATLSRQPMFGLFPNKKSSLEKQYAKLLEQSHKLSLVNRKQSDLKLAEANEVLKAIEELERGR